MNCLQLVCLYLITIQTWLSDHLYQEITCHASMTLIIISFIMNFILSQCVLSNHMSYLTIFQCCTERKDCHGRDRMEVGFTTTCEISAYMYMYHLTTKVVSSNPVHGEVCTDSGYNIM